MRDKKRVNVQLVVCIGSCKGGAHGRGATSQHGWTASAPFANRQPCVRQELQRGPPHSWKLLHKLVNLEGRSLFPPQRFFSHSDTLMMKRAEGKHDAHRHLFMRLMHTCRGDTLSIRGSRWRRLGSTSRHSGHVFPPPQDTEAATVCSGPGASQWWTTLGQFMRWTDWIAGR